MTRWTQVFFWLATFWIAAACCYQKIPSADLWWLLADGRLIAETGSIPKVDPFSWTHPGKPWHNDQWLAAWLFHSIYQMAGVGGLHGLKSLLLIATFGVALDTGRRLLGSRAAFPPLLWALLITITCGEGRFFFDVRAYLFSYLFLSLLWRWLLLDTKLSWWRIVVLFTLWSNLHGGVTSGVLLLILATVSGPAAHRRNLARCAGLALVCCCLNPSGFWLLWHPLQLLGNQWSRYLNEWQPAWRRPDLYTLHFIHLGLWVVCWTTRPRDRHDRTLAWFALFSLTGWRHIPLFALLCLPRWGLKLSWRWPNWTSWLTVAVALWLSGTRPLHLADPAQSLEKAMFPHWAVSFLEQNRLPGKLFHPYGLGGYLCWRLKDPYRVCIDGRAVQVYPWSVYRDYLKAAYSPKEFEDYCQRNQVQVAILFANPQAKEAGISLVAGKEAWKELYRDDLVVIYGRDLNGSSLKSVKTPFYLVQQALQSNPPDRKLLQDALQMQIDYLPAHYFLALLRLNQERDPRPLLQFGRRYPDFAQTNYWLGRHYAPIDRAKALRYLDRQMKVTPDFKPAQDLRDSLSGPGRGQQ